MHNNTYLMYILRIQIGDTIVKLVRRVKGKSADTLRQQQQQQTSSMWAHEGSDCKGSKEKVSRFECPPAHDQTPARDTERRGSCGEECKVRGAADKSSLS